MKVARSVGRSVAHMKPAYQAVIEDLDGRIARLQATRDSLIDSAERDDDTRAAPRPTSAKKHGGDLVVLDVIRAGADTMKAIAAAAKVTPAVARAAVRRLVDTRRVTRAGATTNARYGVVARRRPSGEGR